MANTSAKSFREYLDGLSLFKFDSSTGQVIPQTSDLVKAWTTIVANIFGIPETQIATRFTDSTPFGRIVEALAVANQRAAAITAAYANQVNPSYATGHALDAIASFFNVNRNSATPTKISLKLTGTPGTTIPNGIKVKNKRGQVFTTDYTVQIDSNGESSVSATSEERGKIDFEIGSIDTIVDSIDGLNTVSDTGIISSGYDIETDNGLRTRLMNSRWSGTGFVQSIQSAILRVDGVNSAIVIDNGESKEMYLWEDGKLHDTTPIESGERYIAIAGHSILVVVDADSHSYQDVAKAVFENKSAGCGFTEISGQAVPDLFVSYGPINYKVVVNEPSRIEFNVDITVRKNNYSGSQAALVDEVANAVHAWANGEVPNIEGLTIGQSVYSFEIGAAVSDIIKSIQVANVTLTKSGTSTNVSEIPLFISEVGKVNSISVHVI